MSSLAGPAGIGPDVDAVRRFSRFFTRKIGVLEESLLRTGFSLAEARVLYELAQQERVSATELGETLALDAGYLSRILRRFQERGLIRKSTSRADARRSHLSLSAAGRRAFSGLDAASHREIEAMLSPLSAEGRARLVAAMRTVQSVLAAGDAAPGFTLREHRAGDMGWVVERHGVLYAREYGWDASFEALVAEIVAHFLRGFDRTRERCWIAERDGERVGSIFLVRHPERDGVAKLRLLLVEPSARGLGIGKALVEECTRFARAARYRTITLWTNRVLGSARRLYEQEGYRLVAEEPHHSFGHDLVGQTWELAL